MRRVGINFEFAAECPYGRKIVAGTKLARDDRSCRGVDNLLVKGRAGSELDVERNQDVYYDR